MKKSFLPCLLALIPVLFLVLSTGCGDDTTQIPDTSTYAQSANWLSVPLSIDKPVDVFYLYPSALIESDPNAPPEICTIDNPSMRQDAATAFEKQATAFQPSANIYAPYYRQLVFSLTMPSSEREKLVSGIPTSDATEAFDYYIKHYNNGRPFILAAHSQGANVLSYILAGYLKNNPLVYKRMIAAYVIGYYVTEDYLAQNPHLKFAEGPDDTGVIISYNTEAPDTDNTKNILYQGPGLVINPITWTRDETVATTDQGLGSLMPDPNGVYVPVPQYADACVNKTLGVLICTTADESAISVGGIYHSFDYPFYYFNLRQNAADRINIFLQNWHR